MMEVLHKDQLGEWAHYLHNHQTALQYIVILESVQYKVLLDNFAFYLISFIFIDFISKI